MLFEELTNQILAACFEISNELGAGFVEVVYQNALIITLQSRHIRAEKEYPISVYFRGQPVGQFYADILVEDKILIELKAVPALSSSHTAQVMNYLKASGTRVGLLVNFGNPKIEYRRFENLPKSGSPSHKAI